VLRSFKRHAHEIDRDIERRQESRGALRTLLDDPEDDIEVVAQRVKGLVEEQGLAKAYVALQSSVVRDGLGIPAAIWKRMEPQLREKVKKIREDIRREQGGGNAKKKESSPSPAPSATATKTIPEIPAQYPALKTKKCNGTKGDTVTRSVNHLMASLDLSDQSSNDSDDSDDDDDLLEVIQYSKAFTVGTIRDEEYDEEGNLLV